jgi:endonuclease/exonuclease/phosphatase family metal-dependent hydrolase
VLVRTWNVFHGNSAPPGRRSYLDEMIELMATGGPGIVCVQEVPAWALARFTVGHVAARPCLGPVRIPATLGRKLTSAHPGALRSAFAGQGNAILLAPYLEVLERRALTLNPVRFRQRIARRLGLGLLARLAWAKERRVAQLVRVRDADGRTLTVCNVHCTSSPDRRLPDAELLRAAWFVSSAAEHDDVVILAGDFNVTVDDSPVLRSLATEEWGFTGAGPGIDHILVRGASATPQRAWPQTDRMYNGRLLSDHAPVEVELT